MGNRFYYGMPSTQAFQAMNALDDDVQTRSAAASTAAQAAASSAAQAGNARDAALAAWQAATAPNEQLAAVSKQFHAGAVVDVFLYDTSRDSDGGAWRKRCKHTSWENERIATGKWLGMYANDAAASAVTGALTGDYYYRTSDNLFVELGYGAIYRGNTREFPALALIVVEAARVVIYDATQPALPMWMVFNVNTSSWGASILHANLAAITAVNGALYIATDGVVMVNFITDSSYCWTGLTTYGGRDAAVLALRNLTGHTFYSGNGSGLPAVRNSTVHDLAATVMPEAPIDPATGVPTPTIAVATQAGASIIKHDGTVANWITNVGWIRSITIDSRGWLSATGGDSVAYKSWFKYSLPTGTDNSFDGSYSQGTIPARPGTDAYSGSVSMIAAAKSYKSLAGGGVCPLHLYKEIPSSPTKAMVAFISNAYNSGWQVGDSRGAWLADTTVETISASGELVVNGTFDTNTSGWISGATTIISAIGGAMRIQNPADTTTYGGVSTSVGIAVIPGKWYTASYKTVGGTTNAVIGKIGTGQFTNDVSGDFIGSATFLAPSSGIVYFCFAVSPNVSSAYGDVDNVSLKLAEADRSVKATGLIVNGSLTKAAVAPGAQLVGYSGFSAAKYLEQPYNSALDFGTGDFCVMGWTKGGAAGQTILDRHNATSGGFVVAVNGVSRLQFVLYDNAGSLDDVSSSSTVVDASALLFVVALRRAGTVELWVNGQLLMTMATSRNVSGATSTTRIGCTYNGAAPWTGAIALMRVSATVPSADQIAQIYRDELMLFQPGAQCTIDGTNASVSSMAYDDTADVLHVGTPWGRSAFHGLQRIDSAVASVGAVTAVSAGRGAHVTGGAGGARYQQPVIALRDELRSKDLRTAGPRETVSFDFDSTAGMTDFTLPPGWSARDVLVAGTRKRLGATKDYVVSFDGYRDTVRFASSPGAAWVQVVAIRSNSG